MEYWKLIELLNEYEKDKIKNSEWLNVMYIWKYEWTLHYYNNYKDENIFDNVRFLIISKEYWFIDWLVKKDKVDLDKLDTPEYIDLWDDFMKPSDSDYLTMILSIQDNPIEYLCSILK